MSAQGFRVAHRPAQTHVLWLQRRKYACGHGLLGPVEQGHGLELELHICIRGAGHFDQVPQQAESGDIGAGRRAAPVKAGGGGLV